MADDTDTNFKDWLAEKKIDFDKLPDDEKNKVKKEFSSYETWLAHSKENNTGKKDWADLADSKEKQDSINKFDNAFKTWAKDDQHIDDLATKTPQEIANLYEDYAMHVGKMNINQNQNQNDPNTDWRQDKINSWKNWCEKEHTPAYVYDEDSNEKTALKFDVYKDAEKKEKLATVQYNNPRDVTIGTDDDKKAPSLEFFMKLTDEAKKDKIPGVTFDGKMTDEFKAKLAIACLKNGLKMDGFDGEINTNLLSDQEKQSLDPSLKVKIEYYNAQKQAEWLIQHRQEQNDNDKDVLLKSWMREEKDPTIAAVKFAAFKAAGFNVTDAKEFNADTHGTFQTPDLKYFPEEARATIVDFNYQARQEQIQEIRKTLDEKAAAGDIQALDQKKERAVVAQARDHIRQDKKDGKTPNLGDEGILDNRKAYMKAQIKQQTR